MSAPHAIIIFLLLAFKRSVQLWDLVLAESSSGKKWANPKKVETLKLRRLFLRGFQSFKSFLLGFFSESTTYIQIKLWNIWSLMNAQITVWLHLVVDIQHACVLNTCDDALSLFQDREGDFKGRQNKCPLSPQWFLAYFWLFAFVKTCNLIL